MKTRIFLKEKFNCYLVGIFMNSSTFDGYKILEQTDKRLVFKNEILLLDLLRMTVLPVVLIVYFITMFAGGMMIMTTPFVTTQWVLGFVLMVSGSGAVIFLIIVMTHGGSWQRTTTIDKFRSTIEIKSRRIPRTEQMKRLLGEKVKNQTSRLKEYQLTSSTIVRLELAGHTFFQNRDSSKKASLFSLRLIGISGMPVSIAQGTELKVLTNLKSILDAFLH